jgi:ATP-binding cassette subfamily F protein uup
MDRERPRLRRLSYQEKRELEKIEEVILAAEAERERLGTEHSDPALNTDTPEKVGPLTAALAEAGRHVEELYERWAELDSIAAGNSGETGA